MCTVHIIVVYTRKKGVSDFLLIFHALSKDLPTVSEYSTSPSYSLKQTILC